MSFFNSMVNSTERVMNALKNFECKNLKKMFLNVFTVKFIRLEIRLETIV